MNNIKLRNKPRSLRFELVGLDGAVLGVVKPVKVEDYGWEWRFVPTGRNEKNVVFSEEFHDCVEQAINWIDDLTDDT